MDLITKTLSNEILLKQTKFNILVLKRMFFHLTKNDNILNRSIEEVSEEFHQFSNEHKNETRQKILKAFEEYANIETIVEDGEIIVNIEHLSGIQYSLFFILVSFTKIIDVVL